MPTILQGDGVLFSLRYGPVRGHGCARYPDGEARVDVTNRCIPVFVIVSGSRLSDPPGPGLGQITGPGTVAPIVIQKIAGGDIAATLRPMTFLAILLKCLFPPGDRFHRVGNPAFGR